jgi:hypothetical protein
VTQRPRQIGRAEDYHGNSRDVGDGCNIGKSCFILYLDASEGFAIGLTGVVVEAELESVVAERVPTTRLSESTGWYFTVASISFASASLLHAETEFPSRLDLCSAVWVSGRFSAGMVLLASGGLHREGQEGIF